MSSRCSTPKRLWYSNSRKSLLEKSAHYRRPGMREERRVRYLYRLDDDAAFAYERTRRRPAMRPPLASIAPPRTTR
jgi:hypothetical protein